MSTEDRFSRQVGRLVDRYEGRLGYEELELVLQRHAQTLRARRSEACEEPGERRDA